MKWKLVFIGMYIPRNLTYYNRVVYGGYIGIMENKMETTIIGFIQG